MNASDHALSAPPLTAASPRARRILTRILLVLLIALPCIALAGPGQTVGWMNPDTGGVGVSEGRTVACHAPDGTWSLSPEVRLGRR